LQSLKTINQKRGLQKWSGNRREFFREVIRGVSLKNERWRRVVRKEGKTTTVAYNRSVNYAGEVNKETGERWPTEAQATEEHGR